MRIIIVVITCEVVTLQPVTTIYDVNFINFHFFFIFYLSLNIN
jgi:hypothetical protein